MDHPPLERVLEPEGRLPDQLAADADGDRSRLLDEPGEVRAPDVLHHEGRPSAERLNAVGLDDVGMLEESGRRGLAAEPLDQAGPIEQVLAEELQDDVAVLLTVISQVDQPHATAPEQRLQLVARIVDRPWRPLFDVVLLDRLHWPFRPGIESGQRPFRLRLPETARFLAPVRPCTASGQRAVDPIALIAEHADHRVFGELLENVQADRTPCQMLADPLHLGRPQAAPPRRVRGCRRRDGRSLPTAPRGEPAPSR